MSVNIQVSEILNFLAIKSNWENYGTDPIPNTVIKDAVEAIKEWMRGNENPEPFSLSVSDQGVLSVHWTDGVNIIEAYYDEDDRPSIIFDDGGTQKTIKVMQGP